MRTIPHGHGLTGAGRYQHASYLYKCIARKRGLARGLRGSSSSPYVEQLAIRVKVARGGCGIYGAGIVSLPRSEFRMRAKCFRHSECREAIVVTLVCV